MAADFWAGYISGAIGILIGNPLDLIKVRLQAGTLKTSPPTTHSPSPIAPLTPRSSTFTISPTISRSYSPPSLSSLTSVSASASATRTKTYTSQFSTFTSLLRGSSAPILGYGALNALLFMTYNRSSSYLTHGTLSPPTSPSSPDHSSGSALIQPTLLTTFIAGALGGLATWIVSTPTELVKCRAQVSSPPPNYTSSAQTKISRSATSYQITKEIFKSHGLKGLYAGGLVTSLRDSIGYGFYFWSYEASTRFLSSYFQKDPGGTKKNGSGKEEAIKVLFCGGLAGVVTWASVFPLDVVKTRVQTQAGLFLTSSSRPASSSSTSSTNHTSSMPLLSRRDSPAQPLGAWQIASQAYRNEGASVFFRGLGVCSVRAFVVNAVQWAVYEWVMNELVPGRRKVT